MKNLICNTILLAASLVLAGPANSAVIDIPNVIANGGFGTDSAPSLSGWQREAQSYRQFNGINARSSDDAINQLGGKKGFDSAFSDAFAVLGDQRGAIVGGGSSRSVSTGVFTLSQNINLLDLGDQTTFSLTLAFDYAFNGRSNVRSDGPNTDQFVVSLTDDSGKSPQLIEAFSKNLITSSFSNRLELAPGNYTLSFTLFERRGGRTNTAVGLDNISLAGTATTGTTGGGPVTPIPVPGAFNLLISALALSVGTFHRRLMPVLA